MRTFERLDRPRSFRAVVAWIIGHQSTHIASLKAGQDTVAVMAKDRSADRSCSKANGEDRKRLQRAA
jgi:hypothetical protein